jgi:hypothetical protein
MTKKNTTSIAIINLALMALVFIGMSNKAKTISIIPLNAIKNECAGSQDGIIPRYCAGFIKCIAPIKR